MNPQTFSHEDLRADCAARQAVLSGKDVAIWLPRLIDHTLLKPEADSGKIDLLCREAAAHKFRSICVPPAWIEVAKKSLRESRAAETKLCVVVGFPNGYNTTRAKAFETEDAVEKGATEIDFVQNAGFVKSGLWTSLEDEYSSIVNAAQGCLVKIILETSLLTSDEIVRCTELAVKAGVHVIKTSTGFGSRGASLADLETISKTLTTLGRTETEVVGIKASGGVRSLEDAIKFVRAGATRLGTSSGVAILQGLTTTADY